MEARNRELETERHFKMLAERESGRLKQDLIRMQKSVNDISDQVERDVVEHQTTLSHTVSVLLYFASL